MKTIRTKVYQFKELSEKAKETAIEALRDINVDYEYRICDWLNRFKPIILENKY